MRHLTFKISQESFFQINTAAAIALYDKVREFAALKNTETLLDLYCGTGTIALYLAQDSKKVIGIDNEPAAIKDALANAKLNSINNAEFLVADASAIDETLNPDCVVIDPPRSGLNKKTIEQIIKIKPSRVIYVSCDPAALARDMKSFIGYTPTRLIAVDMFPKTAHVEAIALLRRANA